MAIQFEEIPAGERRQINGPVFGVRVLDVGEGAALEIDRVTIPVGVLVTLEHEIDRVVATGPILFARGESIDDDVTKASATPARPTPSALVQGYEWPAGTDFPLNDGLATPAFQRPGWARRVSVDALVIDGNKASTSATSPGGGGTWAGTPQFIVQARAAPAAPWIFLAVRSSANGSQTPRLRILGPDAAGASAEQIPTIKTGDGYMPEAEYRVIVAALSGLAAPQRIGARVTWEA